jgi:hypothetical protein
MAVINVRSNFRPSASVYRFSLLLSPTLTDKKSLFCALISESARVEHAYRVLVACVACATVFVARK